MAQVDLEKMLTKIKATQWGLGDVDWDAPGAERIVWLFSLVLGHSRMMWARFVARQDLATVLPAIQDGWDRTDAPG